MNHPNNKDDPEYLLSRYLDGDLTSPEKSALLGKLNADDTLGEELRRYTALDENLRTMDRDELDQIDYDAQRARIIAAVERKLLVEGPPRRRLILRPAFRVLAAAAMVLIIASAGIVVFQSTFQGRTPAPPSVTVALLSGSPGVAGLGELTVSMKRLEEEELVMAPAGVVSSSSLPPGTVLVSAGIERTTYRGFSLADMFEID